MSREPAMSRGHGADHTVTVTADGPVLLPGPVEVVLPDGRRVRSERPVTALCVCHRSRRYPFCDTSHRTRVRTGETRAGDARAGETTGDPAAGGGA